MSQEVNITCDHCQAILNTKSSYPAKYVYEVRAINVNTNDTGTICAVLIAPPIKESLHFCAPGCIIGYFTAKEHARTSLDLTEEVVYAPRFEGDM